MYDKRIQNNGENMRKVDTKIHISTIKHKITSKYIQRDIY